MAAAISPDAMVPRADAPAHEAAPKLVDAGAKAQAIPDGAAAESSVDASAPAAEPAQPPLDLDHALSEAIVRVVESALASPAPDAMQVDMMAAGVAEALFKDDAPQDRKSAKDEVPLDTPSQEESPLLPTVQFMGPADYDPASLPADADTARSAALVEDMKLETMVASLVNEVLDDVLPTIQAPVIAAQHAAESEPSSPKELGPREAALSDERVPLLSSNSEARAPQESSSAVSPTSAESASLSKDEDQIPAQPHSAKPSPLSEITPLDAQPVVESAPTLPELPEDKSSPLDVELPVADVVAAAAVAATAAGVATQAAPDEAYAESVSDHGDPVPAHAPSANPVTESSALDILTTALTTPTTPAPLVKVMHGVFAALVLTQLVLGAATLGQEGNVYVWFLCVVNIALWAAVTRLAVFTAEMPSLDAKEKSE